MRNPLHTPFFMVFQNEVLLNSRRVAPYALMIFFGSNAVLWSVAGAAVHYGWATNSDFYIARNYGGFAFGILGLPLFAALIMADPVIRDFRLGVDPLIFSKPLSRTSYLLGKFFGNFFVLVCCQAGFMLTMMLLQVLHTSRMVVLPFRVLPYFKHFFFVVVIPYLLFAAVYFAVGTLTRNAKIVYGLAVSYYPLYIFWQVAILKRLPDSFRVFLDPLLMKSTMGSPWGKDPEWVNQIVVSYSGEILLNRALVILGAAGCLAILYFRFSIEERARNVEKISTLQLSTATERISYEPENLLAPRAGELERPVTRKALVSAFPKVTRLSDGIRANLKKLSAVVEVESRLLLAERSLIVIAPLAVVLSIMEVAFWPVTHDPTLSAAYAANTARSLLLFLIGITVFYTTEAMHRDRDLRIEPLIWSQPAPNHVLLLSKFFSTLTLTLTLLLSVAVIAIAIQLIKRDTPVEWSAYLRVYSLIVIPNAIFLAAMALTLSVLLRNRYLTYAVAISLGAGLSYLYRENFLHWLYNPLLFRLWTYSDLTGDRLSRILQYRIYVFSLSFLFLTLALVAYQRKSTYRFRRR